jgi:dihydroneopterin aldolase
VSRSDRIELRGIRLTGTHGLLDEERVRAQPFEIDLDVELDLAAAGRSDSLGSTVDYADLTAIVQSVVSGPHADLIEHLAEEIASRVLAAGPVDAVRVSVRKLRPPVPVEMASAGVTLTRERRGLDGSRHR